MMHVLLSALLLAQASPSPQPAKPPSRAPAISVTPEFTLYAFSQRGTLPSTGISNALLNVAIGEGRLHGSATIGDYAFPTVGFALAPDSGPGANEALYGPLPVAALTYDFDSHLNLAAGKFGALLGQESPFSYQNLDVQRGIGWAMEPTISRGVQAAYVNGPWSLTLQENDAYYSGANRAFEGLVGWSPSPATSLQFAAILPGANAPGNATTAVGNKTEYDLMFSRTIGKLQVLPYVLLVQSPSSRVLGYLRPEHAFAAALLGAWNFAARCSIAFRLEAARNGSSPSDTSPNADLVGFGPGSFADTQTITPAYRASNGLIVRLEYSHVSATGLDQDRFGLELGVTH